MKVRHATACFTRNVTYLIKLPSGLAYRNNTELFKNQNNRTEELHSTPNEKWCQCVSERQISQQPLAGTKHAGSPRRGDLNPTPKREFLCFCSQTLTPRGVNHEYEIKHFL